MKWLLERLGVWLDRLIGERQTIEYKGPTQYSTLTLSPDMATDGIELGVTVTKITYETRYKSRWWPPTCRSIFVVTAFAPEAIKHQLDERLFQPQTYPMLCNGFLKHSRYPHLYALHAFFDRMKTEYPSLKSDLLL